MTKKTKQIKTKITPEKDMMTSAHQTREGYTSSRHLCLVDKGERSSTSPLALGYSSPWSFPSRSGIGLHAVVQPWLSLQQSMSPWNVPSFVPPSCEARSALLHLPHQPLVEFYFRFQAFRYERRYKNPVELTTLWEREANINWSMVICQGSTRSELP